jgi:hypothetical protein
LSGFTNHQGIGNGLDGFDQAPVITPGGGYLFATVNWFYANAIDIF